MRCYHGDGSTYCYYEDGMKDTFGKTLQEEEDKQRGDFVVEQAEMEKRGGVRRLEELNKDHADGKITSEEHARGARYVIRGPDKEEEEEEEEEGEEAQRRCGTRR